MAFSFSRWGNDLYTGKRSYKFIKHRYVWFSISGALVLFAAFLLIFKGLTPGTDFSGGSEFQLTGLHSADQTVATQAVQSAGQQVESISKAGSSGLIVETKSLNEADKYKVQQALGKAFDVPTDRVSATTVGSTWGASITVKMLWGSAIFMLLAMVAMTLYFRAWRMALSAIVALLHDLALTIGAFALIGWQVTPATVVGFLTVLGYSVYDTVVVFDKVRENTAGVLDQSQYTYGEAANLAVNQTLVRSINTSVVAELPVASILFIGAFILGAGTLRDISLALFVGLAAGTISSIFIATPLEVTLREHEKKIKAHTAKVFERRKELAASGETEVDATLALARIGAMKPGGHLGNAAQPKRKGQRR